MILVLWILCDYNDFLGFSVAKIKHRYCKHLHSRGMSSVHFSQTFFTHMLIFLVHETMNCWYLILSGWAHELHCNIYGLWNLMISFLVLKSNANSKVEMAVAFRNCELYFEVLMISWMISLPPILQIWYLIF